MRFFLVIFCVLVPNVFAQSEILYKFLQLNREHLGISESCENDLQIIEEGLESEDVWALKLLDASASPTTGYVWGNNYWLGSHQSCVLLNDPPTLYLSLVDERKNIKNLTETPSLIPVEYRMFYVSHGSKMQLDLYLRNKTILHVGLCFPQSCNNHDSTILGREVFKVENFPKTSLIKEMWMISTRNLVLRDGFLKEPFVILFLFFYTLFLMLTICGTLYIIYLEKYRARLAVLNFPQSPNFDLKSIESKFKETKFEKFMQCFSLSKNFEFLLAKDIKKTSIPTVHGIRAIGMAWIMTGHIFCYAYATTDNMQTTFAKAQSWVFQPILSAPTSVDTFFVLGGFLMTYIFFEAQKKSTRSDHWLTFVKVVINRYIRIGPSLGIVSLATASLVTYLNDVSMFWPIEDYETTCKKYWWRNVLFIQNLFPAQEICISWSWYVAADFQLFVMCSLLLVIYLKNKKMCVYISLLIAGISALYSGYLGYRENMGFSLDNQYRTADLLYTKPYTRVGAYLIGFWGGWYLSKINRKLPFHKTTIFFGWILTISVTTLLVFGQHYQKPDAIVGGIYAAFGRTLWGVAVVFIIVACSSGNGGFIESFLHAKSFIPFSRISYATYLLNPFVVLSVVMASKTPFHLDFFTLPIQTLGFVVSTYILAFCFMLQFENPFLMFIRTFIEPRFFKIKS